jgi:hypothetical protein
MHARAYRPSQYNGLGGGSGVAESWPSVRVEHVESSGAGVAAEVGALLSVRAFLSLGELTPDDVHVQVRLCRGADRREPRDQLVGEGLDPLPSLPGGVGEPAGGVHEAAAAQPVDDSGQLCLGRHRR